MPTRERSNACKAKGAELSNHADLCLTQCAFKPRKMFTKPREIEWLKLKSSRRKIGTSKRRGKGREGKGRGREKGADCFIIIIINFLRFSWLGSTQVISNEAEFRRKVPGSSSHPIRSYPNVTGPSKIKPFHSRIVSNNHAQKSGNPEIMRRPLRYGKKHNNNNFTSVIKYLNFFFNRLLFVCLFAGKEWFIYWLSGRTRSQSYAIEWVEVFADDNLFYTYILFILLLFGLVEADGKSFSF